MGWYHGSTHRHKLDSTLPIYNLIKFEPIARCQKIKMTQTTVQYRRRLLYSIYSVLLYYCFFFITNSYSHTFFSSIANTFPVALI